MDKLFELHSNEKLQNKEKEKHVFIYIDTHEQYLLHVQLPFYILLSKNKRKHLKGLN